ncbi:hypothetical protein INH39_24920 [Massilia violaceinigra]|uniref:Uncharacterized protein n=1 Tax=Massilia violaceinigra TaxID=2045208 RepID=A0ABY4A1N7_9BURK|nr:hypothetical protein [Massilia violaceinigra]UOD28660.1 hypothetical protein INH39_24920 [Massilia violaceinigra]
MFTVLTTWEGATRLSSAEFNKRFSGLSRIDADLNDKDDDYQYQCEYDNEEDEKDGVVVDGSLHLIADMPDQCEFYENDMLERVACVSGDLHLDEVWVTYMWDTLVAGRIVCKSVWLTADDDCSMRTTPWLPFHTRLLFCWFHKIEQPDLKRRSAVPLPARRPGASDRTVAAVARAMGGRRPRGGGRTGRTTRCRQRPLGAATTVPPGRVTARRHTDRLT